MPSRTRYSLVSDDGFDSRIPLHNEVAFKHGICFPAKLIGTLEVSRPQSRVEIVAAMRRIRFEFKSKGVKKKKVVFKISTDGVDIMLRSNRNKIQRPDSDSQMLMHHPIYRIFYVSHDSQDLKIFSYIARDCKTNVFKCNVFKAYKKTQAMHIVRSVGQAFEVCHKMTQKNDEDLKSHIKKEVFEDTAKFASPSLSMNIDTLNQQEQQPPTTGHVTLPVSPVMESNNSLRSALSDLGTSSGFTESTTNAVTNWLSPPTYAIPSSFSNVDVTSTINSYISRAVEKPLTASIATFHAAQLTRLQLEQQSQQNQVAQAQIHLLKEQLSTETSARIEAQSRIQQLLFQNREILEHLNQLVHRIRQLEGLLGSVTVKSTLPIVTQNGSAHALQFQFADIYFNNNNNCNSNNLNNIHNNATDVEAMSDDEIDGNLKIIKDVSSNVLNNNCTLMHNVNENASSMVSEQFNLPLQHSIQGVNILQKNFLNEITTQQEDWSLTTPFCGHPIRLCSPSELTSTATLLTNLNSLTSSLDQLCSNHSVATTGTSRRNLKM